MSIKVKTSELFIIKKPAINNDYIFFQVDIPFDPSNKVERKRFAVSFLLDSLRDDNLMARSICFKTSHSFYAMYDRTDATAEEVEKLITEKDPCAIVREVFPNSIGDKYLLQLFMNRIQMQDEFGTYNNITGKFLYLPKDNIDTTKDYINAFEFRLSDCGSSFDKSFCLDVPYVRTLTKKSALLENLEYYKDNPKTHDYLARKILSNPWYIIDASNNTLRRIMESEKDFYSDDEIYIQRTLTHGRRKNTIPFFNFGSLKENRESKMFYFAKIIRDMKEQLSPHIDFAFKEIELKDGFWQEKNTKKKYAKYCDETEIKEAIGNRTIIIHFEQNTALEKEEQEKIKEIAETIASYLRERRYSDKIECIPLSENVSGCDETEDILSLRVISPKSKYKKAKTKDTHDLRTGYVKHITTDIYDAVKSDKKIKMIVDVVLVQMLIRLEIKNKFIRDWNIKKEYSFIIRLKNDTNGLLKENFDPVFDLEEKVIDEDTGSDVEEEKDPTYTYFMITIAPEGNAEFYIFNQSQEPVLNENSFWLNVCQLFDDYERNYSSESIEGIILDDNRNPYVVLRQNSFTIPDEDEMLDLFENTKAEDSFPKKMWLNLMKNAEKELKIMHQMNDEIQNVFQNIYKNNAFSEKQNEEMTRKEFDDLLKECLGNDKTHRNPFFRKVNPLCKNSQIGYLFLPVKSKEIQSYYQEELTTWYNIKNTYILQYAVGQSVANAKNTFDKATHIRTIIADDSPVDTLVQDGILDLMCYTFIKNKMPTVLPYPFKYLRELSCLPYDVRSEHETGLNMHVI